VNTKITYKQYLERKKDHLTSAWKLYLFSNHDMACLEYMTEDNFGISKCVLTEMIFVN